MNRIPFIIGKYGQLHRLGSDIVKTHKRYGLKANDYEQKERLHLFCQLADSVSEDWAKDQVAIAGIFIVRPNVYTRFE
jgi:hypothetical protein